MQTSEISKNRKWLAAIIAVSVLARVAVAFYLGDRVVDLPGTFDQLSYDMLAQRVLGGYGFTVAKDWWPLTPAGAPTAHWSYLYTLYLAGVYAVFGYHPLVARVIQAVAVGILMPWLTFRLATRHFGARVGVVAAAIIAGYIYFIYYAATLMTEMFYITAILWSFDIAERLAAGDRARFLWAQLGVALGVAVLLRQLFLLVIPFLSLWLLWRYYRRERSFGAVWRAFGGLVVAGVIVIAMIAPWTVRNYRVFHRFVLLNTNAGFAFYWGNHPIHGYNFISILPADGPSYQQLIPKELRRLDEAALDSALLGRALVIIKNDPVRYVILSLSRTKDYFEFLPSPKSGLVSNVSRLLSFGLMLPFMIAGLVISLRRRDWQRHDWLYAFMVLYTGIHLLSWALIRYRLPVDAILIIFAALAVVRLGEWVVAKNRASRPDAAQTSNSNL